MKHVIDVEKYRNWYDNIAGDEQKTIQSCMDDSAKHLMRMTICCGNFSAQVLEILLNSVCSGKAEDRYLNAVCKILTTKRDTRNNLFQLIKKSNMCHDQCPLKSKIARNKRQFDLASIFDNIAQYMCEDVFEGSADDKGHLIEVGIRIEQQMVEQEYLLFTILMRRPMCCLFQVQIDRFIRG